MVCRCHSCCALSLFQISVGMAAVMLLGTLNRVMIVELSVPAFIVATMIAIPVLIAPFRALLGFKSDNYRSAIGWKRVPYLWFGTLWQFGGLAIMPMALLVLAGDSAIDAGLFGQVAAALAFLLTGLGMHMTQTRASPSPLTAQARKPAPRSCLFFMLCTCWAWAFRL